MGNAILVCGLNGAGKSTLAKAIAERLNLRFIDIEDIYFSKQDNPDYPYEKSRPYGEVVSLLTNIVNDENGFVLASVAGSFGDEFISHLRCVISIEVPKEIRLNECMTGHTYFSVKRVIKAEIFTNKSSHAIIFVHREMKT